MKAITRTDIPLMVSLSNHERTPHPSTNSGRADRGPGRGMTALAQPRHSRTGGNPGCTGSARGVGSGAGFLPPQERRGAPCHAERSAAESALRRAASSRGERWHTMARRTRGWGDEGDQAGSPLMVSLSNHERTPHPSTNSGRADRGPGRGMTALAQPRHSRTGGNPGCTGSARGVGSGAGFLPPQERRGAPCHAERSAAESAL